MDSIQKVEEFFDGWTEAGLYSHFLPEEYDFILEHSEHLGRPGQNVLDIGCGTGFLASRLKAKGHHVTGLDLSCSALDEAMKNGRVDAIQVGTAEKTGLPGGKFDVVVCASILVLIPELRPVFQEAHRILRKGGQMLIFDHHRYHPFELISLNRPRWLARMFEPDVLSFTRGLDAKLVRNSAEKLFDFDRIEYANLYTQHPDWRVDMVHRVLRTTFGTLRKVTRARWTGNCLIARGTRLD